ncbi:Eco57I restriction-modification methylase domain-containing protein [Enhygromyxa salina]|uniref:site-specific DNA-methyltransferase (adenine-specific) n=1 Tax=Enhygromyxa salina TaxID=215803 RepID=A0A2S9XQT9_9BACT|nr:DNA methyltransferase [Enhygromyxa salina]PRP95232.1 N-6 DNA Methylase [Enhygromyxa salina]
MSVLPAADAMELLRGVAGEQPEREPAGLHEQRLTLVLRLIFLYLAEARSLLGTDLQQLHTDLRQASDLQRSADAWPRLMGMFRELHERRGGRLFGPQRLSLLSAAAPRDATVLALLELLSPYAEADVELLGRVYETTRAPEQRRRTSTHYTPRELAEQIASRALEPLARARDPASLRVCDPAMGSGVFVLAALRWLVTRTGAGDHGLRLALTNLFGVDEDPDAVELGKLSVWLETRAGGLRFDCFDHALRCGDALIGLQVEQLRRLSWNVEHRGEIPSAGREIIDRALERCASVRAQLESGRSPSAASQQAQQDLEPARVLADHLIAAFLCSTKLRERAQARARVLDHIGERGELGELDRAGPQPFHWCLEFPQIGPTGFDAIIGNPPFLGKNGILAKRGRPYLDWLKLQHPGSHGNADYAAHFFRRANVLLGASGGTISLVATNTIGQGDTRTTGLAALVADRAWIYDAVEHLEWPGAANVTVSIVHLARGVSKIKPRLNGADVACIDSRLRPCPERADPVTLAANAELAFIGTYVLGRGFVLTPAQRDQLIAQDPRNAARIRPYIGGEQLNTSPTQAVNRYAIDFEQRSQEQASAWPLLLEIIRREVKPGRDKLGDNADGRRRKAYWWQHGRATPSLHAALAPLSRCLVTSLVNKHLVFAFQPARRLFSHKLCVFALDSCAAFAVLQSRVHAAWAWLLSSTMRNAGINYSPSDCFGCFAFPVLGAELELAGDRLERARARYMIEANVGLTKTYNALADPRARAPQLDELRALHVEVDRAVLAAYGWGDVAVPEYLGPREVFDREVIERLFALNAARSGITPPAP